MNANENQDTVNAAQSTEAVENEKAVQELLTFNPIEFKSDFAKVEGCGGCGSPSCS